MTDMAKILISIGVFFILAGGFLYLTGKIPGFGKLPGDVFIKKGNSSFYFPITTSILVSILLSLVMMFWSRK